MNRHHGALLAAVTILTLVTAACGSDTRDPETSTGAGSERNVDADSDPGGDGSGEGPGPWLSVSDSDLGPILVDGEGFTLYALVSSNGDPEACTGPCAEIWPPATFDETGTAGSELDPTRIGRTNRADGTTQVVYGGHPLYRYLDDSLPGDVNGQGVNDVWFVIDPNGQAVVALGDPQPADAPTTDVSDPFTY
jgi:predicted lipoprotein with Yx(FWY)xxD motif